MAENSSLNQILRDVSRQTGMKITGGVTEQRVFGKYGPGSPSAILTTLIEGTGSNMLLRYGPLHVPVELILTPRLGGPSPPSPDSPQYNSASDEPASAQPVGQPNGQPGAQSPSNAQPPAQAAGSYFFGGGGTSGAPASVGEFTSRPGADSAQPSSGTGTTTPSSNATYPPSPNGVRTPPQITQEQEQLAQ